MRLRGGREPARPAFRAGHQVSGASICCGRDETACEGCGVAVPGGARVLSVEPVATPSALPLPNPPRYRAVDLTRCPNCQRISDAAEVFVIDHPDLAHRLGPAIAREWVAGTLQALAILDLPADGLQALIPHLHAAGAGSAFGTPLTAREGRCLSEPWGHVGLSQRAGLRAAYAGALRDRLDAMAPPVGVPCPSGGCLLCGIGFLNVTAAQHRAAPNPSVMLWTPRTATPSALGRQGAGLVHGHLCPPCAEVVEDVGSLGPTSRDKPLTLHVRRTMPRRADRLRSALDDFPGPPVHAWAATDERRTSRRGRTCPG